MPNPREIYLIWNDRLIYGRKLLGVFTTRKQRDDAFASLSGTLYPRIWKEDAPYGLQS